MNEGFLEEIACDGLNADAGVVSGLKARIKELEEQVPKVVKPVFIPDFDAWRRDCYQLVRREYSYCFDCGNGRISLPVMISLTEAGEEIGKGPSDMSQMARAKNPKFDTVRCPKSGRVLGVVVNDKWKLFVKRVERKKRGAASLQKNNRKKK